MGNKPKLRLYAYNRHEFYSLSLSRYADPLKRPPRVEETAFFGINQPIFTQFTHYFSYIFGTFLFHFDMFYQNEQEDCICLTQLFAEAITVNFM